MYRDLIALRSTEVRVASAVQRWISVALLAFISFPHLLVTGREVRYMTRFGGVVTNIVKSLVAMSLPVPRLQDIDINITHTTVRPSITRTWIMVCEFHHQACRGGTVAVGAVQVIVMIPEVHVLCR